jgi:hypothetical protein
MTQVVEATPITNALAVVAEQNQLPADKFDVLRDLFSPFWTEAATLAEQAKRINVTDATQLTEMKQARDLRLKLVKVGTAMEKMRKDAKEESLRTGKVIDGMANVIKFTVIEPQKDRLEQMEKFAERAEAERKAKLKALREELLAPFMADTTFYDLSNMPEETFAQLLDSSRLAHESRIAAAKKAEEDRIAAEAARIAEEKRIREENERLRKEAEEQAKAQAAERAKAEAERRAVEEAARKEREAIQAKAEAERKEAAAKAQAEHDRLQAIAAEERAKAAKLEAEARAKAEAEFARQKAEEAAAKKAARAPDKAKVVKLAEVVKAIALPECSTPEGKELVRKIGMELMNIADRVAKAAEQL